MDSVSLDFDSVSLDSDSESLESDLESGDGDLDAVLALDVLDSTIKLLCIHTFW